MAKDRKNDLSEDIYITKRKIKAFTHSLLYYMCRIFPINQNKIVMWTFEGNGGYGCSPKYVAEELLRRNREQGTEYEIVWLVNDTNKKFPRGITKVKSTLWNRAYHLSTAGTWVSNTRTFYGTKKRKGQCYIQTWHATICIKPIGKYRGELFPKIACLISAYDSRLIDYVLSGSAWCDHMYRKGLLYKGKIIKTGTPRCDVLINRREECYQQIRTENGLPEKAGVMLYAPTFRGGSQSTKRAVNTEEITVDLERLIQTLEKRFGGEWYIFLRLHPQLAAKMERIKTQQVSERLIDVSQKPDINEIIAGSDAFLTDYSSAVFEAGLAGIPAFLYADDLEEYIADRGDLFFDMYKLPFPVAVSNDELMERIEQFQESVYREKMNAFMKKTGIFEDGKASRRVAELIERRRKAVYRAEREGRKRMKT
ncbi:MAG: CDP-glycerol glycerophosphotransferase family protein [Blautia sp.]|nr:CDP-glycerol glycerophosphotransferase family protein [Blautia sp.]MCM1200790.1 CDP-glycerol glycerophosphotransferase family protein [Bacteroides fragilis]